MPVFEAVRLALQTLQTQKLKSAFTLLGVCIGVMFLITVVSIVEGMGRYMKDDLVGKLIPLNSFELRSRPNIQLGDVDQSVWAEYRRRPPLDIADIAPVREALPFGTKSAVISNGSVDVSSAESGKPRRMQVQAVDGDFFAIKNYTMKLGRPFSPQELDRGEKVAVIGVDAADRLFPNLDPIGRDVKMGGIPYQVVGVVEPQGKVLGMSFDNFIIAPWKSQARRLLNSRPNIIDGLTIQSPNEEGVQETMEATRAVMRVRRHLRPAQADNFAMESSESALAFWNKIQGYLVLAGIALPTIGLVVGAIVIMNIMLVAVSQRTSEIGVRKALGAKRRDILTQFLVESSVLGILGSAIGVALGIGLAQLIALTTPLPASVAPWSIFLGIGIGAGVGIISGVYPASRASLLDPVAALRQE